MSVETTSPAIKPKADRFLQGILIGIGIIILVGFVTVFALRQSASQPTTATPGGTVQLFLTSIGQQDFDKAYDLLSPNLTYKPSREEFLNYNLNQTVYMKPVAVQVISEKIEGDSATVNLSITQYAGSGSPFNLDSYTFQASFGLSREDGSWKILSAPYNYVQPYYYR